MREIEVILYKGPLPNRQMEVLHDPEPAKVGESVVWHFTSLESLAAKAKITFDSPVPNGGFFDSREGVTNAREVKLTNGLGHTLGVAPDGPIRAEKYTIEFKDSSGKVLREEDPEIVVTRP